jgi:hypothetical protein
MTLISREDAIEAIASRDETDGTVKVFTGRQVNQILSALPSAELTMGELISRADAIEALRGLFDMRKSRAKVIVECFSEQINTLPSAEAEWIPCSERLPSERELVLISDNNYVYPAVFHPNGVYDGKTVWSEYYWTDLETGIIQNQPDAWMPLPKPYREDGKDYELATEQMEHDTLYEPTYNPEDGSM